MTVVWPAERGKDWPYIGMAVVCPSCNAPPGKHCTFCPSGQHHRFRDEIAETLGFRMVAEAPLLERQK